ncbi:MAG: hemolysin family protein [Acidimicrobiia bacterium]|nr:hemolysin family protein [Acidimicrobiia bacterium]
MSTLQIVYLGILAVCVASSGFLSGSETALIGIPRERVLQLEDGKRAHRIQQLVSDPDRMLSTLLVANNFVNITAAAVATVLFIDLAGEDWGPWLATLAVTAVILLFGEITPKTIAARYPERFSLAVAPSIWRLSLVLRSVSRIFEAAARVLFRLLRLPRDAEPHLVTEDDIRTMALLGERGGEIETVEREIIHSLFGLADQPIREVMTPRVDVDFLTEPVSVDEVRQAVAETGRSRFPVVREDLDSIIGVLYVKDLFRGDSDPTPDEIRAKLRKPSFVPESKSALSLLQEMRTRRLGFAVVSDEHGGVEGVVTVKDLVGELLGEIPDEYDTASPSIFKSGATQWIADGMLPLEELEEAVGIQLPDGEYATVGGLFISVAGRIPEEGDELDVDTIEMKVLRMDRNRIDQLRVQKREDAASQ